MCVKVSLCSYIPYYYMYLSDKALFIFSAMHNGQVRADRYGKRIYMIKWGMDKPTGAMWKNE